MRFFTVLLFTIPLAACSKHAPQLEFKPEEGAKRDYQIIVQTDINTESSYGRSHDSIRSMMLTNYQVTQASTEGERAKGIRLHIQPTFMLTEFRNGDFASSREPSSIDQDMRQVMRHGFDMQLSPDMGVTEFQINALNDPSPGDAILESLPPGSTAEQDLLHMFRDEFTRPGLAHGLPLQEGASREIPARDERPAVRVTLHELRTNEAILTIEGQSTGQDSQSKIFGIAAVDIRDGWVNRATMVTDIQYQEHGSTASVRSIMSLYPGDWVMGMELDYLGETSMMPLQQDFDFTNLAKPAERAQALASETGTIEHQHDHMRLIYHHSNELTDTLGLGQFELRSPQAYSVDGEPLELELQLSEAINYSHHGSETLQTLVYAYPLGWQRTHQQLTDLVYVQATLDWYPQTQEVIQLAVADSATEHRVGDATAVLQPTDDPRVYRLTLEHGHDVHFDYRVNGASAAAMGYKAYADAPDWLTLAESRLLTVSEHGYHPGYYELYFDGQRPQSIELLAIHVAPEPAASRRVSFYDEAAMNENPYVPPAKQVSLYASQDEIEAASFATLGLGRLPFESTADAHQSGEFPLHHYERPQLYLTLTPEQAGMCQLEVDAEHMQWHEVSEPPGERLPVGKLNDPVVMQLQSPDGRRQYFYDDQVEVSVACPADFNWHPLDIAGGEHPWLILLDDLDGITPHTPVVDLLRTHAFLPQMEQPSGLSAQDIRRQSLALVAPQSHPETDREPPNYFTAEVADYLYEGKYLRFTGAIGSVMRLQATANPRTYSFTHQFPALPELDTTFSEQQEQGGYYDAY